MGRQAFGTHDMSENVFFFKFNSVFFSTLFARVESMEFLEFYCVRTHITHVMSENQTPVHYQRCQSGPSARNSVVPSGGDAFKNSGADQQRLQISDLHIEKFLTPATFACWTIICRIEVYVCSQFLAQVMFWVKEVELLDSVDELRSSCSARGIQMKKFDVFGAEIVSAQPNHP